MKNIVKIDKKNLIFRQDIKAIKKKLFTFKPHHDTYFDFDNVAFISHGFADELVKLFDIYKDVHIFNLKPDIKTLIKLVKSKREKIKKEL